LEAVRKASTAELAAVPGIGSAAAHHIRAFFRTPSTRAVLDALERHGVAPVPPAARRSGALAGRTVVFTGTLDAMTRAAAERLVEESGGRAGRSVTHETDLVVAGRDPGSK